MRQSIYFNLIATDDSAQDGKPLMQGDRLSDINPGIMEHLSNMFGGQILLMVSVFMMGVQHLLAMACRSYTQRKLRP